MNGQKEIQLILKKPNFDKAFKIEKAINEFFKQQVAHSIDPTTVKVKIPEGQDPVEFISKVLALKIETDQEPTVVRCSCLCFPRKYLCCCNRKASCFSTSSTFWWRNKSCKGSGNKNNRRKRKNFWNTISFFKRFS